ncbi:MAG: TetR/AcrR family transcriptional regulator [Pseudomonadota bacterium]
MTFSNRYTFAEFKKMSPIDGSNIWSYILERNAEKIGVKRPKPALENLEKIFVATFRLANDVGFQAMSLRDLCKETGMSMGGLYGYIDSKDQLAEMIEDVVRHTSAELPQWFGHIGAPLDRLEGIMRGYIYLSEILQPWFYFVYMDSRVLPLDQRKMAKNSELHVQQCFEALIAQIAPQQGAPLLAAHCLAVFQDWYVKRWKYRAAKVQVDAFADSAIALIRAHLALAQQEPEI